VPVTTDLEELRQMRARSQVLSVADVRARARRRSPTTADCSPGQPSQPSPVQPAQPAQPTAQPTPAHASPRQPSQRGETAKRGGNAGKRGETRGNAGKRGETRQNPDSSSKIAKETAANRAQVEALLSCCPTRRWHFAPKGANPPEGSDHPPHSHQPQNRRTQVGDKIFF